MRKFNFDTKISKWRESIKVAREKTGATASNYPDAFILANIHVESGGNEKGTRPNSRHKGLLQMSPERSRALGKDRADFTTDDGLVAIVSFIQFLELPAVSKIHEYIPEFMVIAWRYGPQRLNEYKKLRGDLEADRPDAAREYLSTFGRGPNEHMRSFQRAFDVWTQYTNEPRSAQKDDFSNSSVPSKSKKDTHWGKERSVRKMTPFDLGSYITPEELRKGIIAQFYYINEWHITKLAMDEAEEVRLEKETDQDTPKSEDAAAADEIINNQGSGKKTTEPVRSDTLVDQRRRYVQSLVEAEFYRRRYNSRNVPTTTGPFNPYPVAGFTGLIMTPGRPIIGYITNVSHSINVSAASGTTAVSMRSPRYWDEGEVWYWFGGEANNNSIMRNFPQWHNREVVATNNVSKESYNRPVDQNGNEFVSKLDRFYEFMIGSRCIEYSSNHRGLATPEIITKAVKDRDPGPLEVKPETLEILEYNEAIATLDEKGRFAPGTLANKFYGPVEPYDVSEANVGVEEQLEYVERYGVREKELLVDFLGNSYGRVQGSDRLIVSGPTFGGSRINSIQNQILEYMKDLEKRRLDGGV